MGEPDPPGIRGECLAFFLAFWGTKVGERPAIQSVKSVCRLNSLIAVGSGLPKSNREKRRKSRKYRGLYLFFGNLKNEQV